MQTEDSSTSAIADLAAPKLFALDENLLAVRSAGILGGVRGNHGNGAGRTCLPYDLRCLTVGRVSFCRAVSDVIDNRWQRMPMDLVVYALLACRSDDAE